MNETNVFASRPSFPQKHFLHKKCVKRMSQGFNESHVLAGPVQGLLVCKIALFHGGRRNTPKAVKYPLRDILVFFDEITSIGILFKHLSIN